MRASGRQLSWLAFALVVVGATAFFVFRARHPSMEWPRTSEARLSGASWAPLGSPAHKATARDVLAATKGFRDAESLHARGIALIQTGRFADAIEPLEDAAKRGNATAWNDLAVAYDADAVAHDRPWQLATALAAADRALRIDRRTASAAFNRALILEHLGDTAAARTAWNRYLTIDALSEWAREARTRVASLERESPKTDFRSLLREAEGQSSKIAVLVETSPGDTRNWAEGPLLAEWAKLFESGDHTTAARQLAVVRDLARALGTRGEHLAGDAVAAIDAATGNETTLRKLAAAHRTYDAGRAAYAKRRPGAAEQLLLESSRLFASGKSPMADSARYFAANTVFDQNRTAEAHALLLDILADADVERHRALHAQLRWQIARCEVVNGSWSAAQSEAQRSIALLAALGERRDEAFVRALAAGIDDYLGNDRRAWRRRVVALRMLSQANATKQVRDVLANTVRSSIRGSNFAAAVALADVVLEHLRLLPDPGLLVDTHLQRARAAVAMGEERLAADALRDAQVAVAGIADRALRERAEADVLVAQGVVARHDGTGKAVAAQSEAIEFFASHGYGAFLVDAYLERARSYRAAGAISEARADLQIAIAALERERQTVDDDRSRALFFDRAPAIFGEAIDIDLRRSDVRGAFETAELARARTLREQLEGRDGGARPLSIAGVQHALPSGGALIELAFTGTGVAVFLVTPDGLAAHSVPIDAHRMRILVRGQRERIEEEADEASVRDAGAELYDLLLRPLQSRLRGVQELIFVGDRDLESIALAALFDRRSGRYLAEDYAISVTPSAAFFSTVRGRSREGPALIVGDPESPGFDRLPGAEREASALGRLYPSATVLVRRDATPAAVAGAASTSAVVHIATHARSDEEQAPAILLTPGDTGDGSLDADAISALRLDRTALAVLAACSTARARTTHMEGMPSLARAFLTAGVPTVVATLWDIEDDDASSFFRQFHTRLAAGDSPARACQLAQIRAMRSSDASRRHPRSWAGITVIGNGTLRGRGDS